MQLIFRAWHRMNAEMFSGLALLGLALAAAVLAAYLPALRAASVNPVEALRHDQTRSLDRIVDRSYSLSVGRTSDARERLVGSGRELMQERGYTAVGVAELCDEAGVNKGSFYHVFPSKRELALEVIDSFWAESAVLLDRAVAGEGSPLERLRGFFEDVHAHHRELRGQCGRVVGCPLGNLAQEMSTQDPVLRERLGEIFDRYVDRLERVVAEAVGRGDLPRQDTRRAARSLTALLEGAVLLAKTRDDPEMLEGLGDDALRMLGAPVSSS